MSQLVLGGGGRTFAGSTNLVNLLISPDDLSAAAWTKTDSSATATQITMNNHSTGRVRDNWFAGVAGHRMLHVLRAKSVAAVDSADNYYNRLSLRYFDQVLTEFVDAIEDNFYAPNPQSSPNMPVLDDGVYRNYYSTYTALETAESIMFDILARVNSDTPSVYDYEVTGLYDLNGLSGWVLDPNYPQVRFNLDQSHAWWGDSVPIDMALRMGRLLNVIDTNDMANGGQTSDTIATEFLSTPELHNSPTIIWSGHNSIVAETPASVLADINSMTDALEAVGTDYRVLTLIANKAWTTSPPTDNGTDLSTLNDGIISYYGEKAVDVFSYLKTKGDGSANDIADVAAGILPRSLQSGTIHLNDRGKDFAMDIVYPALGAGWYG